MPTLSSVIHSAAYGSGTVSSQQCDWTWMPTFSTRPAQCGGLEDRSLAAMPGVRASGADDGDDGAEDEMGLAVISGLVDDV
ncbi:hypothetical protein AB0C89_38385, partial [Streptomyces sp. NPDC048491]